MKRNQAVRLYRFIAWLMRISLVMAAIVAYYFYSIDWVNVTASSIDGRQYAIEFFGDQ